MVIKFADDPLRGFVCSRKAKKTWPLDQIRGFCFWQMASDEAQLSFAEEYELPGM
jgi:hypothetical protein